MVKERILYNLTNAQKSIWITEQFYKNTNINNITGKISIDDKINFEKLTKAINMFLEGNIAMRTRIVVKDGIPMQYFKKYENEKIDVINFHSMNELKEFEGKLNKKKYQIIEDKLYRFYMYSVNAKQGGVIVSVHHLINDAWSLSLLVSEIMEYYTKLIETDNQNIYYEKESYINYIERNNIYKLSNRFNSDKAYWEKIFDENLMIDNYNTENTKINAEREEFILNSKLEQGIESLCKEYNISFFTIYMIIVAVYFSKLQSKNSILIGTPVLNRGTAKEKETVGMFVNTVPFRIDIDKEIEFIELLNKVKKAQFNLFKHQKLDYEDIFKIAKEHNKDIKSLFDIVLSYQNARDNSYLLKTKYTTTWNFNGCISNALDIHITDIDNTGKLKIIYDYQTNRIKRDEIRKIHKRLTYILGQVINNKNILINNIEIITKEEKRQIIDFNNIKIDYPKDKNIITIFKEQVNKTPNKVAIVFEDKEITYKELDIISDKVATYLTHEGLKKGDIIGILLPRSLNLFISIIGILKIGGIYLSLDLDFPDNRIEYILKDSKAKTCITELSLNYRINKIIKVIEIEKAYNYDKNKEILENIESTDGCYIIYTSGTTGQPKGVLAMHKNIINYVYAFQNEFKLNENDVVLQQFSASFDAFSEELYPALLNGIKIVAISKETLTNLSKLSEIINKNEVTLVSCAPLMLNELNKLDNINNVRIFISGGDVLKKEFYSNLINYADIYNTYGPTETTVCSTYHKCKKEEKDNIPIGKTIANYKNFIISEDKQLLPLGCIGELCIGGDGISKGYLNNKELTKEKFILIPSLDNEKVYKTGDICKINDNNEIEFVDRIDKQLKIRGYRVSLIEIEKCISEYPGINQCVVTDFEDGLNKKRLCAYYISTKNISNKELVEYTKKLLPPYMVPTIFIKVDKIPTNISGKIDKRNLPNPRDYFKEISEKYIKPITCTQVELENLWKKILKIERVSIDTNIFELGADSLSIIEFQTLSERKRWNVNAQLVYDNPTIRQFAQIIDDKIITNAKDDEKYKEIKVNELKIEKESVKHENILLTGATGFLGIHILNELLKKKDITVYCLIRGKDLEFSENRLHNLYKFYFKKDIKYDSRIKILKGDITREKLGLENMSYRNLCSEIDTVIHTAAIVKHYGNYETFEGINVVGTKNIIDFCIESNSELHYMSTISVAGYENKKLNKKIYTENDFYIGQSYNNNVYIKRKLEAEYSVFKAIKEKGLYAKIYRLGNLTGRLNDGVFQKNIDTNAFYQKIKSIISLKYISDSMMDIIIDFTPIDIASKAIVKVIFNNMSNQIIYHMYNTNTIKVKQLIEILSALSYDIDIVTENTINLETKDENTINDIYSNVNKNNLTIFCDITEKELQSLGFKWSIVDREYINKLIEYMKKVKFL